MKTRLNISPVLPVDDINNEIEFFNNLGFASVYDSLQYSNQLDYAVIERENQCLHLQLIEKGSYQGQQIKIRVSNISSIEFELSRSDLVFQKNYDTLWNTHELGLFSPSKHAIFFVQEIK